MTTAIPALGLERDTSKYRLNGHRLVSVTEALQIAGVIDLSGIPVDYLEEAANRGRLAHKITESWDKGELKDPDECPAVIRPYLLSWISFCDQTGFKATHIESVVTHPICRYAGTLDRAGYIGNQAAVIDLKSGASVSDWVGLQLSGYQHALVEESPDFILAKRYGVRLTPAGRPIVREFKGQADRADFLGCVRVANWKIQHMGVSLP